MAIFALLLFMSVSLFWIWPWPASKVVQEHSISLRHKRSAERKRPLRGYWKSYKGDVELSSPVDSSFFEQSVVADAIIVGSGLAGLTAALTILDRGGTVWIIEKEPFLGGNSNKASSGINGCCFQNGNSSIVSTFSEQTNDTLQLFYEDTFRSAGDVADITLIETLIQHSAPALKWLMERVSVDLSAPLVQLGGHSRKRTHRPKVGFVGAEVMNAMATAIRKYEMTGHARIMVEHKVTRVIENLMGQVKGVQIKHSNNQSTGTSPFLRSDHVILATGGFASDRSVGSLLRQYRPELQNMAATAGSFSTGDGIRLAQDLGATTRDMEKIQIHPTGFVDPSDPTSPNKVLAAELLRGVGGILLNKQGKRFCNELGTRAYITDKMLQHDPEYITHGRWNTKTPIPTFYIVLSAAAVKKAQKHVDTYMRQGLITKVDGLQELADHINISRDILSSTLQEYQSAAKYKKKDEFEKTVFENVPDENLNLEEFFVGEVTPVLHYCMGGLKISPLGQVMNTKGEAISGLYGIGEVTGGVHGNNRLGGNSLLECAVFGRIVGQNIPVITTKNLPQNFPSPKIIKPMLAFTVAELSNHKTTTDCLVGLYGNVYNLTKFHNHHAGGKNSILSLCGIEATKIFSGVHSSSILSSLENEVVGYVSDLANEASSKDVELKIISRDSLARHNSFEDCWVVIYGMVYDFTEFSKGHPGGAYIIQKMAGKDATSSYQVFHPKEKLKMVEHYLIGKFSDED